MPFSMTIHRKISMTTLILALTLGTTVTGQCTRLEMPLVGLNGQKGCMFDVVNLGPVPITVIGFDQSSLSVIGGVFEIYTHPGTWAGTEAVPGAWALVAVDPAFVPASAAVGTAFTIGAPLAVVIPAGGVQAFYLTYTLATAANVRYSTGLAGELGAVTATDGVVAVMTGVGKAYPFAASFGGGVAGVAPGRKWNGRISYSFGLGLPAYELNDPVSSLDIDGTSEANPCVADTRVSCLGSPHILNVGPTIGFIGHELAFNYAPLVPVGGGALVTPGGQALNLDLAPGLFFVFGGVAPMLLPPAPAGMSIPFAAAFFPPGGLAIQGVHLDFLSPDGISLSRAVHLTVAPPPPMVIPGPAGDDVVMTLVAGVGPFCAPAVSLYGVSYTTYHVTTNGRITYGGAPNASFTPVNPGGPLDPPFAGVWGDFNTLVAGGITINHVPDGIRVDSTGIGFFGGLPAIVSTFRVTTTGAGTVTIDNALGAPIALAAGAAMQFLGISPGGAAAIAPAVPPAPWFLGTLYFPATPVDAIGTFGLEGTALVAGTTSVSFLPTPAGYVLAVF